MNKKIRYRGALTGSGPWGRKEQFWDWTPVLFDSNVHALSPVLWVLPWCICHSQAPYLKIAGKGAQGHLHKTPSLLQKSVSQPEFQELSRSLRFASIEGQALVSGGWLQEQRICLGPVQTQVLSCSLPAAGPVRATWTKISDSNTCGCRARVHTKRETNGKISGIFTILGARKPSDVLDVLCLRRSLGPPCRLACKHVIPTEWVARDKLVSVDASQLPC